MVNLAHFCWSKKSGVESEGYKAAFRNLSIAVVVLVGLMGALYVAIVRRSTKANSAAGDALSCSG